MKHQVNKSLLTTAVLIALGLSGCNIDSNTGNSFIDNPMLTGSSADDSSAKDNTVDKLVKTNTGVIEEINELLTVNGVSYATDEADILVEGEQSDISALKQGMLVSVTGVEKSDGSNKATYIHFEDDIEGTVLKNNVAANGMGVLNVLGQSVRVDENTVFESYDVSDSSISDIDVGNIVEVSGHASGDGDIWASRVEVKNYQYNPGEEIELKGNVSNVSDSSFTIGAQQVSFENAALDSDFMNEVRNGQYVEVKSYEGLDSDDVLLASEVELIGAGEKEIRYSENDDEVEIKGVVTVAAGANDMEINGSRVFFAENLTLSLTTLAQMKVGEFVEAEGYVNNEGNFFATKLELESRNDSDSDDYDRESDDDSGNDADYDDDDGSSDNDSRSDSDDDANDDDRDSDNDSGNDADRGDDDSSSDNDSRSDSDDDVNDDDRDSDDDNRNDADSDDDDDRSNSVNDDRNESRDSSNDRDQDRDHQPDSDNDSSDNDSNSNDDSRNDADSDDDDDRSNSVNDDRNESRDSSNDRDQDRDHQADSDNDSSDNDSNSNDDNRNDADSDDDDDRSNSVNDNRNESRDSSSDRDQDRDHQADSDNDSSDNDSNSSDDNRNDAASDDDDDRSNSVNDDRNESRDSSNDRDQDRDHQPDSDNDSSDSDEDDEDEDD